MSKSPFLKTPRQRCLSASASLPSSRMRARIGQSGSLAVKQFTQAILLTCLSLASLPPSLPPARSLSLSLLPVEAFQPKTCTHSPPAREPYQQTEREPVKVTNVSSRASPGLIIEKPNSSYARHSYKLWKESSTNGVKICHFIGVSKRKSSH